MKDPFLRRTHASFRGVNHGRNSRELNHSRRHRAAVSEIIGTMLMILITVTLAVTILTFFTTGVGGESSYFTNLISNSQTSLSDNMVIEQVQFGTLNYVPITISNSQSSATPSPFQQTVTINPSLYTTFEAGDLGNIRFYSGLSSDTFSGLIDSWLEYVSSSPANTASSAVFWLKLPNGIPSSNSITVYMTFLPVSSEFDGNVAGEAPQLSGTYGQYDNGANVFNSYYQGGTASGWTTAGTSGATSSAPAGNPIFGSHAFFANSANGNYLYTPSSIGSSQNVIIQFFVWSNGLGNFFFTSTSGGSGTMTRLDTRSGQYSGLALTRSWTSWDCPATTTQLSPSTWYVFSIGIAGGKVSDSYSSTLDYTASGTTMNSLSNTYTDGCGGGSETYAYNGAYLGLVGDGLGSSYVTYWSGIIVRAYPPTGTMPSVVLGSLTNGGATVANLYVRNDGEAPITISTVYLLCATNQSVISTLSYFSILNVGSFLEIQVYYNYSYPAPYTFLVVAQDGTKASVNAVA